MSARPLVLGEKMKNRTILIGDVMEKLREIPGDSIDVVVSSPPYWALRDYKAEGQWGLEPDFHEYLKKMDGFMSEIKRVLKKTGTVWINLGDTYAGGTAHSDWTGTDDKFDQKRKAEPWTAFAKNGVQAKSRYGIPERFYINCIDNGWLARNHIPWVKPNAMPQSIKDRLSNKWESIFFFAKHQKYYFNLTAVREIPKTGFPKITKRTQHGVQSKLVEIPDDPKITKDSIQDKQTNTARLHRHRDGNPNKQDTTLGADGQPKATYKNFNQRYKDRAQDPEAYKRIKEQMARNRNDLGLEHESAINHPAGKNPGDVLVMNSKPFLDAHFATFPLDLPLWILRAAGPREVCSNCKLPRFPIVEPTAEYAKYLGKGFHDHSNDLEMGMQQQKQIPSISAQYKIAGWTKCDCNESFQPGIVLDPFFGAGTTAVAAEMLGLDWCGIELKQEYVSDIITKRLDKHKNKRLREF